MKKSSLFTPVERIDGKTEQRNRAEKHMHFLRYRHAASLLQRNKHILDIACGYGYGSRELHDITGAAVDGIDISSEAVRYATDHYAIKGITYRAGSITDIPAKDYTYDAIVSYETIEHVSYKDGVKALDELHRVLKPGGHLLISTPNRIYTYMLQLVGYRNPFHIYEYYPAELRTLLKHHGFSIQATYGQSICFPPTYYLARREIIPSGYFYPSRYLPGELSMIAIIHAVKQS